MAVIPGLSVAVRVTAVDLGLVRTVEDATAAAGDVALLHGALDPRARPMVEGLAGRWGARLVAVAGHSDADFRNAALGARHDIVLLVDSGDRLDPSVAAALAGEVASGAAVAAAPVRVRAVDGTSWDLGPPAPASVFTQPDAVPSAYVFARAACEAAGGFDPAAGALADAAFWARTRGPIVVRPGAALVTRPLAAAARPALSPEVLEAWPLRHAGALARDPASVLGALERRIAALDSAHRPLAALRVAALAEVAALDAEIAALEDDLRGKGQAGVDWGDLRRTSPVSREWGYDRGTPLDRPFIEAFLAAHAADVRGHVLEVQEGDYTARFGGDRVTRADVVDVTDANPRATVLADLRHADALPSDAYDCFILTQTLHVIDDVAASLAEAFRVLKPGGVLLATFPAASRVCVEYGVDGDFWRMTEAGARALVSRTCPGADVAVHAFGNVLATAGFLYGVGAHELAEHELAAYDPQFPMLIGVRARKPEAAVPAPRPRVTRRVGMPSGRGAAILLYHRVDDPPRDAHRLSVPPSDFRMHIEMLRARHEVVPLAELVRTLESGRDPSGLVALTFDDGYRDNLELASPILVELETPATFFVTSEHLDRPGEYWWDALERVLLSGRPLPPSLDLDGHWPAGRIDTSTAQARLEAHALLHPRLVAASLDERRAVMDRLLRWAGTPPAPARARALLAEEVAALAARPGHDVGCHGAHHLALGRQPADVIAREVELARRRIAEAAGRPVDAFAYPYGDDGGEAVAVVRASGMRAAVTCEEAPVRGGADVWRLPRMEVKAGPAEALEERLWRLLR